MKKVVLVLVMVVVLVAIAGLGVWLRRSRETPPPPAAASKPPPPATLPKATARVPAPREAVAPPVRGPRADTPWASRTEAYLAQIRDLKVSAPVRVLVGLEGNQGDFAARAAALKKLTRTLSHDDELALNMFLDFRFSEQDSSARLPVLEFEGLKNDALSVLLAQERLPAELGGQLVTLFRDREHDPVWRNYCVQYMPEYYQRRWPAADEPRQPPPGAEDPQGERAQIEAALREALQEKDTEMAGTALLALADLSPKYPRLDAQAVRRAATALAGDDACGEPTRIAALRTCGMLGCKEALPAARSQAQTGASVPLRQAAIATVGEVGGPDDAELLRVLGEDADPRISKTAAAALQRLSAEQK